MLRKCHPCMAIVDQTLFATFVWWKQQKTFWNYLNSVSATSIVYLLYTLSEGSRMKNKSNATKSNPLQDTHLHLFLSDWSNFFLFGMTRYCDAELPNLVWTWGSEIEIRIFCITLIHLPMLCGMPLTVSDVASVSEVLTQLIERINQKSSPLGLC